MNKLGRRTFVLLDDITGYPVNMNWVIYNPTKIDFQTGIRYLEHRIREYFNIQLTQEELYILVCFNVDELDEFVSTLQNMISRHKVINEYVK